MANSKKKDLKVKKKEAEIRCKFCGSRDYIKFGFKKLACGKVQRYYCMKCHRIWY